MARAKRSLVWPTVVGVIAIVFGIFGVLGGVWGTVWQALLLADALPPPWNNSQIQNNESYNQLTLAMQPVAILVALMLLIGGILLTRRSRAGVRWLVAWSIVKLVYGTAAIVVGLLMQPQMLDAMTASSHGPAPPRGIMSAFMIMGMVIASLWIAALPVFLLIWFTRVGVKADVDAHFLPRPEGEPA